MIYRQLGRTGLKVSVLSIGSWMTFGQSVDEATTETILSAAYAAGINHFDGAEAYGSGAAETCMGTIIARQGWRRDTLVLSGKASPNAGCGPAPTQKGLSRKHLIDCCDATLKRYRTDYIDIFYCHRPDPATPLEETVRAMNELIQRGKICYWGTSEFPAADLLEMHAIADRLGLVGPQVEQSFYNLLGRERVEDQLVPLIRRRGLGIAAYCPLASGLLSGRWNDARPTDTRLASTDWMAKNVTEAKLAQVRGLAAIAGDLGVPLNRMALAWIVKNPDVSTAILGASKAAYIADNVAALDVLPKLDDAVMARIAAVITAK
jgi:voltage-dependent potassium channel beta subunit